MPDHPSWPAELVEKGARQIAAEFGHEWVFESDATEEDYDAAYWRHVATKTLSALSGDLVPREEHERVREFAFGDAPEWEKANTSLKHRVREVESQADALAEALEEVRPVLERLLREAGWFDHDLLALIDGRLASYRSSSSTETEG